MKIALLGWGSLLWDGGAEFDQSHSPWEYDGPILKVEFSRVSKTRLGALTLVIDEDHGTLTTVAWCLSKRTNVDDAACDLRNRESTALESIGRVIVTPDSDSANRATPGDPILCWARLKQLDAVVWTALKSNFKEKAKQAFSVDAVVAYIKTLKPDGKAKAAEYAWRAPNFVKTPVRSALQTAPWFSETGS